MKQKTHFTKMQGCGNDYIYVDASVYDIKDPSAVARAWSDRHKGIGSDGLVLIGRSMIPQADYSMRIFNADGSEAMMCGNASRCVGKYLYERSQGSEAWRVKSGETVIRLQTLSGIKLLYLHIVDGIVESVTVDMGEPLLENDQQFVPCGEALPAGTFVSMGNPHYVIFVDDVEAVDVAAEGFKLENHPAFPERCNIEFATPLEGVVIRTRVWERGSGITQACGTGACATAVAAALTGEAGRTSHIVMDGGTLDIEWRETDNHVLMTGPAEFVFDGEAEIP